MAKKRKTIKDIVTHSKDVPVTHLELIGIKRQMSSMNLSINKKIQSMDEKIDSLEYKIDSRFTFMNSRFDQIQADIYKVLVTVEEQNARNKAVMDSQAIVQFKFQEHDSRISSLEEKVHGIK